MTCFHLTVDRASSLMLPSKQDKSLNADVLFLCTICLEIIKLLLCSVTLTSASHLWHSPLVHNITEAPTRWRVQGTRKQLELFTIYLASFVLCRCWLLLNNFRFCVASNNGLMLNVLDWQERGKTVLDISRLFVKRKSSSDFQSSSQHGESNLEWLAFLM